MKPTLKKNKSNETLIDEYMNSITLRCENNMPIIKKPVNAKYDWEVKICKKLGK